MVEILLTVTDNIMKKWWNSEDKDDDWDTNFSIKYEFGDDDELDDKTKYCSKILKYFVIPEIYIII